MTEEQIVKEAIELTTPLWTGYAYVRNATIQCRYELLTEMINLVNHKNEQIEALISGQETLQKYIAEKDAEIERLKGESKRFELAFIAECELSACPRKREIRGEAIKEFSERLKDLTASYWLDNINKGHIDKVVKEMVGDGDE